MSAVAEFNAYRDGKVHVMREECSTCIFRPHERFVPGSRVAEMVTATKDEEGATVICHHTLEELTPSDQPVRNAICRGWYDRFSEQDMVLRAAQAFGIIEEQDEVTP